MSQFFFCAGIATVSYVDSGAGKSFCYPLSNQS